MSVAPELYFDLGHRIAGLSREELLAFASNMAMADPLAAVVMLDKMAPAPDTASLANRQRDVSATTPAED